MYGGVLWRVSCDPCSHSTSPSEGFAARLRTLSVIAEGRSTKLGSTKSGKSVGSEGARTGLHEASSGSAGSGTLLSARLQDSTAKRDPVGARPVT